MKKQILTLMMLISLFLPVVYLAEEAEPVTATSMLADLKAEMAGLTQETLPEARALIIPELMSSPVLEVSFGDATSITLLAPDGRRWILTQPAPETTPEPISEPTPDPALQLGDSAEPSGNSEPTADTPVSAPETPTAPAVVVGEGFTAYVFDGSSVLVFFQADTYGEWSIEADRSTSAARLYYVPQEITTPLLTAINQDTAAQVDETSPALFSLGAGLTTRQSYPLTISSFTQNLQERYGDQLQLLLVADNDSLHISPDNTAITCKRTGTHVVTASLHLGNRLLCTQQYNVSAANTAPILTGSVPSDFQYKYWDIEYPARMFHLPLAGMAIDPEGTPLTWSVALQEQGPFDSQITLGGLVLTVEADELTVSWPEAIVPEGEYSFVLCVQDDEGGRDTQLLSFQARSMQRDLEQLMPRVLSPKSFSERRAKASTEEVTFLWENAVGAAGPEVLTYLQNYADIRIGISGHEAAWQAALATDSPGKYMAKVTYPRQAGTYTIDLIVTTRSNAPLAFEHQYTLPTVTIDNLPPTVTKQASSSWKLLLSATASVDLLASDAFTDDGEWLQYLVTTEIDDQTHSARFASLPYTFVPGGYGLMTVSIRAIDVEGLTSEGITFSFVVIPSYLLAIAGAVILALLALIVCVALHLTKPQFPAGSQLLMMLSCGPVQTELQLCPARWKREPLPLDRMLACGETPLLSRESCEQLRRILIKPHSRGFVLVDKTKDKLLQEASGRIDFDENLYFDLEEVSITLQLHSPRSN